MVLPTPGGPQKTIEPRLPSASIAAERAVGAEQVVLADHLVEPARAQPVGKRTWDVGRRGGPEALGGRRVEKVGHLGQLTRLAGWAKALGRALVHTASRRIILLKRLANFFGVNRKSTGPDARRQAHPPFPPQRWSTAAVAVLLTRGSAWRRISFQAPSSRRKRCVTLSAIAAGVSWPARRTTARSIAVVLASSPLLAAARYSTSSVASLFLEPGAGPVVAGRNGGPAPLVIAPRAHDDHVVAMGSILLPERRVAAHEAERRDLEAAQKLAQLRIGDAVETVLGHAPSGAGVARP